MAYANDKLVTRYCRDVLNGKLPANKYQKIGVSRYLDDKKSRRYSFKPKDAEFVIGFIENLIVHAQGETLDGKPLRGEPFLLQPYHKFIIYNLLGFYHKGTKLRRYQEAFIYLPRKNVKTSFSAAFALAMAFLERKSGSKVYIVAAALKQALESFSFMEFSIKNLGKEESGKYRIRSYNGQYSIERQFDDGSIFIQALASNPENQDSLNMNVGIADEIHAYKNGKQYSVIKDAMKAYANKLMIGITSGGDNMGSFCYQKLQYCKKVLDKVVDDEAYFVFIAEADDDEHGNIDFTNPLVHAQANPAYGVTIRPDDILRDSKLALNDPQLRKEFYAKSLNVFTSGIKTYFDIQEFRNSDSLYDWGYQEPNMNRNRRIVNLKELVALDIKWYGGADLSKRHDLTAAALYGVYKDIDNKEISIMITHAWYPRTKAAYLADELGIPFQGWQDSSWLSFVNSDVIEYDDLIKWYLDLRSLGFEIETIGYDPKYATLFARELEKANFEVSPVDQRYFNKTKGFREIEMQVKRKCFYYLHSEAFEYNVINVKAVEDPEERVRYEKTNDSQKIDMFDAGVAAALTYIDFIENDKPDVSGWFG